MRHTAGSHTARVGAGVRLYSTDGGHQDDRDNAAESAPALKETLIRTGSGSSNDDASEVSNDVRKGHRMVGAHRVVAAPLDAAGAREPRRHRRSPDVLVGERQYDRRIQARATPSMVVGVPAPLIAS
jgi:hypothetical protein